MGINGLLPLLKSIHKPCSLKKFDGKTLGVDAYGWLHRGTVSCAMDLAMGRPTRKFVDFCMHRVRMLQHYGVTPYIIFDGDYLPSKAATEADRSKRREDSRKAGLELLNAGKTSQAYLEFQKAVDVTPEMARQFIDELKNVGVKYVVAPYEADAQMVYLERKGILDGIISEDSDLLVFGAKCLLTKLDQYGNCIEINKADFCAVKEVSLTGWSDVEFRRMAILSGCDYLASMSNMGLKTAYRMVRKHKTIEKILRMLSFDGKFLVPKGYLEAYQRAELTFLHQRVYCPIARRLVLHTEPEQPLDDLSLPFLGAHVEPDIAQGVARGDLNPITKLPIVVDKKSKMENTPSPWTGSRSKPQRSVSLGEAMRGKPINTFFQKRVPLGELDINCFTPSPSQENALRRNSGPWTAEPVPRPYLNRSMPEAPTPARVRSTPIASSARTRRTIRSPTISEPRPAKRARLCEDNDSTPSQTQKIEAGRSRFFDTAPDPSPSTNRNVKSRKSKKYGISIFSDDSIEEAMLSLTGADTNPEVFKETEVISVMKEESTHRDFQIQSATYIDELPMSQQTVPSLTSSTSITSSAEQPSTPHETSPLPKAFRNLGEKFAAGALSTPKSSIPSNGNPTHISTSPRSSKIPLAVKSSVAQYSTSSFFPNSTPLQRLGAAATRKPKLPATPPMTPISVSAKSKVLARPRSLLSKNTLPFPEVATEARKRSMLRVVEPASIPLPEPNENEMIELRGYGNGSEDLIIHDSEEEGSSPICGDLPEVSVSRINFAQFAYSG